MAYTFIARMKKAVAEHGPYTLLYRLYKLKEPYAYAVIESFLTEARGQAHQDSTHFKEIVPDMIKYLDGGYDREFLNPL